LELEARLVRLVLRVLRDFKVHQVLSDLKDRLAHHLLRVLQEKVFQDFQGELEWLEIPGQLER
jgi:hypothetical protein